MDKPKHIGSFMNINKVNKWLVNIDGCIVSTKRIKDLLDEKTFREMSCYVVTSIYTN